jgi:hypothetical protein
LPLQLQNWPSSQRSKALITTESRKNEAKEAVVIATKLKKEAKAQAKLTKLTAPVPKINK